MDLVGRYGPAWSKISKIVRSRNGKQIRDRYINVLDPSITKTKFTKEDDYRLICLYNQVGSKWATIASYFPNRTADMLKNRFHSSLKRKFNLEELKSFGFNRRESISSFNCFEQTFNFSESEEKTFAEKTEEIQPIESEHYSPYFVSELCNYSDQSEDNEIFYNENKINEQSFNIEGGRNFHFEDYFTV